MNTEMELRVKAAEEAVRQLAEEFVDFAQDDMKVARVNLDRLRASTNLVDEDWQDYFTAIHNIKGLGGSFGYHLISYVAESNCRLLKFLPPTSDKVLRLCEAHLVALEKILERNIKGDGGEAGRKIIEKLVSSVDEIFAEMNVKS